MNIIIITIIICVAVHTALCGLLLLREQCSTIILALLMRCRLEIIIALNINPPHSSLPDISTIVLYKGA